MRKKINSVFANLAISYLTIVIVIVLLLSSIFYMYFPKNYNEEIRNKNQIILENTANYIESAVFQRVQKIYLDLSLEESANIDVFVKDTLQGNYSSVIDIQELLKNEVTSNSDIVYAVHLFYPKQKIMISSDFGLRYYDEASKQDFVTMDWIDRMLRNDKSFLWTEARRVPQDIYTRVSGSNSVNPLISYAHSYPFNSTGEDCDLMIAIDIKETAFSNIIENIMPSEYKNTYIINESGKVISAANKGILGSSADTSSYLTKILSSNEETQSFTDTIDDIPNVVSSQKFMMNEWKIYSTTPTNNYYKKSIVLQKAVLLICLLTIVVGMVLSGIFTIASYNPMKRLLRKVNPIIKHNVVLNILSNRYSHEELAEQLQSLNISMEYSNFCCMMIDPASEKFKALSSKTMHYVIYRLINQLEAGAFYESHLIAEELPDHKIVVIVCTNKPEEGLLEKLSGWILSEVNNSFDLEFKISLGNWVQQFMDVHKSFVEAQTLIKYGYFLPEISIIKDINLLNREHSNDEIPQSVLLRYNEKLQARQLEGVVTAVDNLLVYMRDGQYSADYCHIILMNMISVYSDCLISVRYKQSDNVKMDLHKQYTALYNINSFRECLIESISEFFSDMDKRSDHGNVDSIEAVKQYISKNLSEELSLDTVAGKVFISPKYLSKIFKEETGINYIEYITKKRMEKALELMTSSNMTIEQIANTVGFATSAYFIKKFKELNGCTPKNYRRQEILSGRST